MGSQHQVLQPQSCCQPASTNQSRSGLQNLSFWVRKRGRTKPCSLGKASIPGIQRDSSPRGAAGKGHPLGMPAGQGQGLGTVQASAHLLLVGRGGPQLPPGPPPMRPYELCLQTLQPPPRPGSPMPPPPSSSPRPTAPTPLPRGEPWAPQGRGGALSVAGSSHRGAHGDTPEMFFWGVTQQQRPKWGSGLVSLLRGPSHSGQGAAGAQRQPLRGEANSPAPLPLPPAPPCQPGVPWCPRRCCSPCWLWPALPGSSTPCGGGGKVRAPKGATAPIPGTAGPIWGAEWGRSWGGLCVVLWVVLWVVLLCHDFSSCPQTSRDPWER